MSVKTSLHQNRQLFLWRNTRGGAGNIPLLRYVTQPGKERLNEGTNREEKAIRVRMLLLSIYQLHTHRWVERLVGKHVTYVGSKAPSLWSVIFHKPLILTFRPVELCINFFFSLWRCRPTRTMASPFLRFLDHTQWRITVGRTPLYEWSARRRELYLTTHNTYNRQTSTPPVGFEPTISAGERPQTYALDRATTGTGPLT